MQNKILSNVLRDTDQSTFLLEYRSNPINMHLLSYMTFTGYEKNYSNFLVERKGYVNLYVINYTISGMGILYVDDKKYEVGPGDLVIFPLDVYNKMVTNNTSDISIWEFVYIHVSGVHVSRILNDIISKVGHLIQHKENYNVMERIYNIHELINNKSEKTDYLISESIEGILMQILYLTERQYIKHYPDYINQSLDFINLNFLKIQNLDDIIKPLSISKAHFLEQFKKHLNLSPMNFVNQKKLTEALIHIKNQTLTLIEISNLSGFKDERSLLYTFKKHMGMTPKEYKSQLGTT